jgi:hypothetical protein
VNPKGAVFQPDLIELMQAVLDDATATLPQWKRTSAIKAEMASNILACAAKGERNPFALKMRALLTPSSEYTKPWAARSSWRSRIRAAWQVAGTFGSYGRAKSIHAQVSRRDASEKRDRDARGVLMHEGGTAGQPGVSLAAE